MARSTNGPARRFLFPGYGELTVFLIAFTLVALFALDPGFRHEAYEALRSGCPDETFDRSGTEASQLPMLACCAGLFLAGLGLSLYHTFTNRPRGLIEKHLMLAFAMAASGLAGVAAGRHMLKDCIGIAIVFPVWNIANGVLLLYQLGLSEPAMLDDSQVTRKQLLVGIPAVLAILLVCRFAFACHWSIAFSVCVAYSTSVSEMIMRLPPFRHDPRVQSNAPSPTDDRDRG